MQFQLEAPSLTVPSAIDFRPVVVSSYSGPSHIALLADPLILNAPMSSIGEEEQADDNRQYGDCDGVPQA